MIFSQATRQTCSARKTILAGSSGFLTPFPELEICLIFKIAATDTSPDAVYDLLQN